MTDIKKELFICEVCNEPCGIVVFSKAFLHRPFYCPHGNEHNAKWEEVKEK